MGNYFFGTLKWNKQFFRTSSRSNKIQIPRTPLRTRHTWGSVTQHIYNVYLCFVFIDLFVWKTKNIEIFWHLTGKTWHSSGFQMSLFACFFCANLFNRWLFKFLGILGEDTRVCARGGNRSGGATKGWVGGAPTPWVPVCINFQKSISVTQSVWLHILSGTCLNKKLIVSFCVPYLLCLPTHSVTFQS